jgi:uncharacterized membrane protein (UPF0182 family)
MRNSVKASIDAYDGTTTFYVFDTTIRSSPRIARIFPEPVQGRVAMPPSCAARALSGAAAAAAGRVYGLYHMTDPGVFYNREDLWTVATEVG